VEAVVRELFSLGLYKRTQGRIARQATFAAMALLVVLGAWSFSEYFQHHGQAWKYFIPLGIVAVGLWASFRVVQIPAFADFLISVEGEMNKVSWPSRGELFRASVVVILVIFFLAFLLFGYDALLSFIMKGIDGIVDRMVGE
jgi:preprotein translocase subunit SecE